MKKNRRKGPENREVEMGIPRDKWEGKPKRIKQKDRERKKGEIEGSQEISRGRDEHS